jgi:hypothetical protein
MLWIIAILLFAIAVGNEGSRKVLFGLVSLLWTLAVVLLIAAIAIGIVGGAVVFTFSGSPYGPLVGILYIAFGLMTANFYANKIGEDFVSLRIYFVSWMFWPLALPFWLFVEYGKVDRRSESEPNL